MRPSSASLVRQTLVVNSGLSALVAIALWTVAIIQAWPRLMVGGPICSAEPAVFGHCPACLPAIAATLMATGFAVALLVNRKLEQA
jgi:hypothetical protein